MLYRIGLRYTGGGLVIRPEAIYFVRLLQKQGRFFQPEVTALPLPEGCWREGQPVYGEGVATVLRTWLQERKQRVPRPLIGCLAASHAYFGALTLPAYEANAPGEIDLQIQQAVPMRAALAIDYQQEKMENVHHQRVTYVATRQSEVSAIARFFQQVGCPLTVLELDVFALWRATLAVAPASLKRESVALLWVGKGSALFAVYERKVVVATLAWSADTALSVFIQQCAGELITHHLSSWTVCASNREGADAVIAGSRVAGVSATFLDLMPYGLSHETLADAFLAWGLALRGASSR